MSQNKIFKLFIGLLLVSLVIIGVVLLRSCHRPEDPQHTGDDDITHVMEAPHVAWLQTVSA